MRASDDVRRRAIQIAAGGRNSIRQSLVKTGEARNTDTAPQQQQQKQQQRVSASLLEEPKQIRILQSAEPTGRKRGEKHNPNESGTQHEHGDVRENTHGGGRLPVA